MTRPIAPVPDSPPDETLADPVAADVARGIARLFARNGIWCLPEMPLRNGRRADLMGIDAKGLVVIVEIKVARADLLGDAKWPDYLDHCDRFFWGVPPGLDRSPLESEAYRPDCCGIIVADGYDAEILRHAPLHALAAARRKVEVERLARVALRRQTVLADSQCADFGGEIA
ncbi:MAG: MmcB family DNA repair protein [Erythrobacter sp.]|uniref:MmcB family DNA repair protein n=1 Tax=Erythrobacter sp. TaxID=1042 RepID=UPI0032EF7CA2